jgi:hypothetical protein
LARPQKRPPVAVAATARRRGSIRTVAASSASWLPPASTSSVAGRPCGKRIRSRPVRAVAVTSVRTPPAVTV